MRSVQPCVHCGHPSKGLLCDACRVREIEGQRGNPVTIPPKWDNDTDATTTEESDEGFLLMEQEE